MFLLFNNIIIFILKNLHKLIDDFFIKIKKHLKQELFIDFGYWLLSLNIDFFKRENE